MLATSPTLLLAEPTGSPFGGILVPILMFAAIYFILIRPMSKQEKERKARIEKLGPGENVRLAGGIIGRIHSVEGPYAMVEVADRVRLKVVRAEIADRVEPEAPTKTDTPATTGEAKRG